MFVNNEEREKNESIIFKGEMGRINYQRDDFVSNGSGGADAKG
jgi:hypothetical protein